MLDHFPLHVTGQLSNTETYFTNFREGCNNRNIEYIKIILAFQVVVWNYKVRKARRAIHEFKAIDCTV